MDNEDWEHILRLNQQLMRLWIALALNCALLVSSWASEHADIRDGEVLKAVLEQLLPRDEKPPILILSELTPEYVDHGFSFPDFKGRRAGKLSREEIKSLVENMVARNSIPGTNTALARRVSFAALELGPQVVISSEAEKTMKEFRAKYGSPKTWLEASLPGYSRDERRAIVCLRKWGNSEGAIIRVFVEKKEGRWGLLSMEWGLTGTQPPHPLRRPTTE